jgi:hypothetical protein
MHGFGSDVEQAAFVSLDAFYKKGAGYASIMNTRPQTIGYGLADSPAGLPAWIYDKFAAWTHSGGEPQRALTRVELLDDITLYWLTNTGASSSESYWEVWRISPCNAVEISIPVGVTIFPGEILSRSTELGGTELPQADLLKRGRRGRSFRGVGAAGHLHRRDTGGVPITALGRAGRRANCAAPSRSQPGQRRSSTNWRWS